MGLMLGSVSNKNYACLGVFVVFPLIPKDTKIHLLPSLRVYSTKIYFCIILLLIFQYSLKMLYNLRMLNLKFVFIH